MKRFLILITVLGLVGGLMATAEAKGRPRRVERTVEASYGPSPAVENARCDDLSGSSTCVFVQTRSTESFLTANVTDAHGQPVSVEVHGMGIDRNTSFCGKTTDPIRFQPGARLELRIEPTSHFWSTW